MEFSVAVERKCAYPLYEKHAELWTLRILCRLIGHERGPLCTGAVKTLRQILGEPYSDSYKWAEMEALWRRAEDVLSKLEQAPRDMDAPVFTNIRLLGMQLSLSAVAQQILALRVLARIDGSLCSVMEGSPSCDQYRLAEFFSVALDEKPEAIIESLRPSSALIASGLLSVERAAHDPFHKTRVLPWLTGILMVPYGSFEELFAAFAKQCTPSTLALSDFRHIAEKADLLTRYLARACAERAPGRNVLLYGPPGTGKTELARLAASVDGLVCYEGDVSDEDGEPLDVGGRQIGRASCRGRV